MKSATFATVATTFLAAGNAQAAMEVANIAAGDGRGGLLLFPVAAALGWVGFNILQPAQVCLWSRLVGYGAQSGRSREISKLIWIDSVAH